MSVLASSLRNNSVNKVPVSGVAYLADMFVKRHVGLSLCVRCPDA